MFTLGGSIVTEVRLTQLLWHSSPGASNVITIGLCDFWKIPTPLHIWISECLRCKYLSKSHDKMVTMRRSVPMLFSSSEVYLLPNFVDWLKPLQNEDTFNIALELFYFNLILFCTFKNFTVFVSCPSINKKSV